MVLVGEDSSSWAASCPATLVYEDEWIVVVDKPQGLAVHPAPRAGHDTLTGRLHAYYSSMGQPREHIAPVSRLDRGTSGLVLLAVDSAAHGRMHWQVVNRKVRREYSLLVWGRPLFEETTVDVPVGRHWREPQHMAAYDVSPTLAEEWAARRAVTHFRVGQRFPGAALLGAVLDTGRMHQIRVHSRFIRLPVIGDPVYGLLDDPSGLRWQCLHAGVLRFRHPVTGVDMDLAAPLPASFLEVIRRLQAGELVGPGPVVDRPPCQRYTGLVAQ
jgi:23S rRNA pseudouridine1911/1915/1917 synthase